MYNRDPTPWGWNNLEELSHDNHQNQLNPNNLSLVHNTQLIKDYPSSYSNQPIPYQHHHDRLSYVDLSKSMGYQNPMQSKETNENIKVHMYNPNIVDTYYENFHSDRSSKKKVKVKENFKNIIPSQYQNDIKQITVSNPIILEVGPGEHQIKDYNFQPVNVLFVNYLPQSSDFIYIKLICDPKMNRSDPEIFMFALSPLFSADESNKIFLPNLKISKDMLKGRTKGFEFNLEYSLVIKGSVIYSIRSNPFCIWSNVNQNGFPRDKRDEYVNQTESINKKRRRP